MLTEKSSITLCEGSQLVPLQLVFIVLDVQWIFIVLLVYYPGWGDGSGSLSGGAFNQLKIVTLNTV